MISHENLLIRFKPLRNIDFEGRHFLTNVPWRGPNSYLHIWFDAARDDVQQKVIDPLHLPPSLKSFFRKYNGADLFTDTLSIYGFFPSVYQFAREDWRKQFPYNIIETNLRFMDDVFESDTFVFGSYGFDRSKVYIAKDTGEVLCGTGDDLMRIRKTWPSFEVWLTEEITRMCDFFDEEGHQLVDLEDMLPVTIN